MRTNYIKIFLIVSLFACFLFTLNTSAQTEQQSRNPNIDSAIPEEVTEKLPQTDFIQLSPAELSRIKIPNIQQSNNPGEGRAVYLSESFETPFTGDPAAPPGWTQSRVVLLGDGIPEPNGVDGEKDWQRNVWNDSVWAIPGWSSGIRPTGAVSGTGILFMEDSRFGSTTSSTGGFGSRRVESPSVNLTSSTSPYVRFWFFYNSPSANLHVKVVASSNGGATWNILTNLPPNADVASVMTAATPWQRINVLIPAAYRTANAKFGIEMTNVWGTNEIFIDDFIIEDFTPSTITSAQTGNWNDVATWVGGVIPTADNHVVIADGHTVTVNVNIARCQNLTVNGTFTFSTTTTHLSHIFGNLTVNPGGTYNSFNGTSGRRAMIGGNFVNNGTANFSVGAGNLVWLGGGPASLSGTGTFVNGFTANSWHLNSAGVTYNMPLESRFVMGIYEGSVNPNGNLTAGIGTIIERTSRGSLSVAPIWSADVPKVIAYITANIQMPTKTTYSPGNEMRLVSGTGIVDSAFVMSTYDNLQLNTPVTVGTATRGLLTLTRGIIITSDVNILTLNTFIAGPAGTAPSILTPPTTHGSYVAGPMIINFPATGTATRNFALGVGTGFNGPTPNSNVLKTVALSSTSAWTGSTVKASIVGAPSGTVNSPLTNLMGPRAYRLDLLGGADLPGTTTVTIRGRNSTFGNSDNMIGDISEIRVAQSPSLTGPWTSRSNALGSGVIVNNTDYARTTAVAAPGPIAPLGTNGEYFALATTSTILNPSGVTATPISSSQINLQFTPNPSNNNVVIVFNLTGTFTDPVGAPPSPGSPFAGGTLIYNGLTSPFNHTGLSTATTYYYKLFSYDGTVYSAGVSVNAATLCDLVSTFPWGPQGFEGTFPPNCWTRFTGLLENPSTLTSTTSGWIQDEWQNVVGSPNKAAKINIWSTTVRHWLMTPQINLGTGTINYQLEFDLTLNAFGTSNPPGTSGVDDKFAVVISTDGGITWSSANTLRLWDNAGSPYVYNNINYLGESVVINLTGYTGIVQFAFYGESTISNADNDLMIDNVQIRQIPVAPIFSISPASKDYGSVLVGNTAVQNFTISNTGGGVLTINNGGITLTGANNDQFSLGTITYPINLNAGENVVVQVTFAPTSTGIKNANLQVVHNAPGSPGIAALTGRALPAGILYEQFTGTTFPPDGWLALNSDGGTQNWIRDASKFNSAPASASSRWESTTLRNDDWLITPRLSVVTGDELSFFISSQGTTFTEELVVKIGATNDPNGSWTNLDSILTNDPAWVQKTYDLSAYNGQNVYIAFVNRGLDKFRIYVDDVVGPLIFLPANDLGVTAYEQSITEKIGQEITVSSAGLTRDLFEKDPNTLFKPTEFKVSIKPIIHTLTESSTAQFEVTVKNFGTATQNSFQVGWEIDGVQQSSVSNTSPLAPGAEVVLQLTWSSATPGLHNTRAWTILAGDENPANDTSGVVNFFVRRSNSVFFEGFETTLPPTGWLTVSNDGGGTVGPWAANPTVFAPVEGNQYIASNFSGANGFLIDDWLISPNTGGGSTTNDSLSFYIQSPVSQWLDSLEIRVSTTGTNIADFTQVLAYIEVPKGQWTEFKYALPSAENRYIAFRYLMYDGGPNGTHSDYIGLDAVEIFGDGGSATFQLSVSVSNGWNMVAVPGLHPVDQNVNTWWAGKDPAAGVFRFAGGYQAVTTVAPGTGYWMKHLGANTYNTGDEWPAGGIQIVPNDPIPAVTGWNLIGGYHLTVATAGITTTPVGLISGQVFGYTPGSGYSAVTNLVPGYGYWIKLSGAGNINLPTSLAKSAPVSEYIKSDWGRIMLTDAAGKSYTLYSVNGEIDLTQYELPPLPPAGMFDVRYGSQRLAEVIGSEIQTIEMQGIEYPVTVRVEGMTIRVQDETGKIVNQVIKSGEDVVISNPQVGKLKVSGNVIPETYSLEQNYPNPFNPSTTIEFSIPEDVENVKLTIYDALGQKVAELVNGKLEAGRYSYQWDASKLASGLYIYQLQTSKFTLTKKMLMLK